MVACWAFSRRAPGFRLRLAWQNMESELSFTKSLTECGAAQKKCEQREAVV